MRSFVRRAGRITSGQRRALAAHWSRFGLPAGERLDLDAVFERHAPRVLEIGFGSGDALLELATAHPERDYLGIEVHEPGLGRLLGALAARGVANVRVLRGDARELLERCLPDRSLAAVLLFFPDPWPKKRHHKRRLVDPDFVALVAAKLAPGGRFELATDWEDYARQMLELVEGQPGFVNLAGRGRFAPRPSERPATRFERRGAALGHRVRDLQFELRG